MIDDPVYNQRFGGISRLYGRQAFELLPDIHICIVGIGGVGSWAAEVLARTGVGSITLIDMDEVCDTNVNRQVHALNGTIGKKKVEVMAERIRAINPSCQCQAIVDFITVKTLPEYINGGFDYVIDAIDSIKFKSMMIAHCKRNKIPIITTGGAGGLTDPAMIEITDLSKTFNDPLAAKVRSRLRSEFGFSRNTKRRFGVECVFSRQQQVYPREDGTVTCEKPGIHGVSIDCRFGYGSASFVTAVFGMLAASRALNKTLEKRLRKAED
ncbi:MAG: tRNA cyclic N6-threonylcarbamoyladenosine(37) synthase TcdA [Gammaproteobacteria bacterium]|nr:tRNA cyclic N6-threonylcarbamoyladenosine(37) synthase TcdA [Gammaproteobacteria bacterium]